MPIHGLTDRGLAFPVIGQIRKGAPKKVDASGKTIGIGEDLTYFRVEFDERETEAARRFAARYPDGRPTDIVIVLPFNEIDRMWEAWREAYTAGTMVHRCDGQQVQYQIDPHTNEKTVVNGIGPNGEPVPCDGTKPVFSYKGKDGKSRAVFCKPVGRLRVIIPELERLAYVIVKTTSIHDIINISEQLEALHTMNKGRLAGIPLVLRRRPVEISTPSGSDGQRARRIKWLVSIEADPEWVSAQLAYMKHVAMPGNGDTKALPAPAARLGPDWGDAGEGEDGEEIEGEILDGAEETPEATKPPAPPPSVPPAQEKPKAWPVQAVKIIIQNGLAKNSYNACGALNLSQFLLPTDEIDVIVMWAEIYRTNRQAGLEPPEAALEADETLRAEIEEAPKIGNAG